MLSLIRRNALYIAFAQALAAMLGSLYYSQILHYAPCVLCWYQRILMYPLVLILAVGIMRRDKNVPYYVLPLSIIGIGFALYHYLLQRGIIPDSLAPCSLGVSCTTKYVEYFGFVTIPFLSLLAFVVITACMWISIKQKGRA